MGKPHLPFDFDGVFGEDYLRLYRPDLTAERNAHDCDVIIRLLNLQAGSIVLDLGCGHGRIANEMARRGAMVTGLDASSLFLEQAHRPAAPGFADERGHQARR